MYLQRTGKPFPPPPFLIQEEATPLGVASSCLLLPLRLTAAIDTLIPVSYHR